MDRHFFRPAADARPANGSGAKRIERCGDAHIGLVRTQRVDRVESDPPETLHMRLRPGVTGDLPGRVVISAKIAAHIARGDVERARAGDEDMREILANAATLREGLGGGRRRIGRVRIEGEWWDVPDEAVIKEPNRAGRTMVWPVYHWAVGAPLRLEIRCFMPGTMI